MAINLGKLFTDMVFQSLDKESKLFYMYLATHPSINTIGVVALNMGLVPLATGLSMEELREATKMLKSTKMVYPYKAKAGVYFFLPAHFESHSKSEVVVKKAKRELAALPQDIYLSVSPMVDVSAKFLTFNEPSEEEIVAFAASEGYVVDAKTVIRYYRDIAKRLRKLGWWDSRGKQVKNWKGKLKQVWFKEENRLEACPDAPKGFEFFYVNHNGKIVTPDSWRNGKPYSKEGMSYDVILQKEYEQRKKGSS